MWHFKCIRPILSNDRVYPQFLCPNCRAVADLEADIEDTLDTWEDADDDDGSVSEEPASERNPSITIENGIGNAADGTADDDENLMDMVSHMSLNEQNNMAPLSAIGANRPSRRSNHITDETVDLIGEPLSTAPTPSNALRDPRAASETLEGVVTPRNEAGPFVFDGSNGRMNGGRMPHALAAAPAEGAVV